MICHELIGDEIISHEILRFIIEERIITDGDEVVIRNQIDTIHEILEMKDSDHVQMDGMFLVNENGYP